MVANVNGKDVNVYTEHGKIVRRFRCRSEAVSAYVSGDQVTIQLKNGHSEVYKLSGTVVRRF